MSHEREKIIEQLQKENKQLREKLENALSELAESVRAEVSQQFAIKDLLEKIDHLTNNLKELTESLE
jgi:small-conductance mechanosensitive channel|tara:strand:- start:723 stop:923 length:201 start_codon:yes stop_codon:yes gene_type:complete